MKTGLVVEGGGMKCAYSAGILDGFLDYGIKFDYCIGVSAGAANLASFTSGQRGRNRRFYTEFVEDPEYFGARAFVESHDVVNLDYIYGTLSNEGGKGWYDFDATLNNPCDYEVVATDAITGKPKYFSKSDMIRNDYCHIKASSALPVICRPIVIDDIPYYDGGVSDAIPVDRALEMGCDRILVIMSKPIGFHMQPKEHKGIYTTVLHKYPEIIKAMDNRHTMFRRCRARAYELELEGKVMIVAPGDELEMGTYKMDAEANTALYYAGMEDFLRKRKEIEAFLKGE